MYCHEWNVKFLSKLTNRIWYVCAQFLLFFNCFLGTEVQCVRKTHLFLSFLCGSWLDFNYVKLAEFGPAVCLYKLVKWSERACAYFKGVFYFCTWIYNILLCISFYGSQWRMKAAFCWLQKVRQIMMELNQEVDKHLSERANMNYLLWLHIVQEVWNALSKQQYTILICIMALASNIRVCLGSACLINTV